MEQHRLEVASEIYAESDFSSTTAENGFSVTYLVVRYPDNEAADADGAKNASSIIDQDGDLLIARRKRDEIKLLHQKSTNLTLVGLQIWRGAFVLADFLIHNHKKFARKRLLELGAGVGLTTIAAAIHAERDIVCTDINMGGILELIQANINTNRPLIKHDVNVRVMELNFMNKQWSMELCEAMRDTDIVIAADVIYDNDITDHFVETLIRILHPDDLNRTRTKQIFIALEKRYVFTVADLDVAAPCYEYFLQCLQKAQTPQHPIQLDMVDIDFPQYFTYERSKELIIMRLKLQ